MTTYLVTGAAGFIGSNLVEHLLSQGHNVVALDNVSTGLQSNLDLLKAHQNATNLTLIIGDIKDTSICNEACSGVDYVLHQAALGSVPRSIEKPELYNDNNIVGTFNMMKAASENKVKRFVYASSSSVYGDTPALPKVESMVPNPKSPYAISKISNEYYGKVFNDVYGLPTVGLRYFNVFGPRQDPKSDYAAVIPKFVTSFLKNESPTIYGDGEQTRDFTFIDNVIKANVSACNAHDSAYGNALNVGCGERISLNLLATLIKEITCSSADIIYAAPRTGDVRDSLADITRLKEWLGVTQPVLLRDGLAKTIEWYGSQVNA